MGTFGETSGTGKRQAQDNEEEVTAAAPSSPLSQAATPAASAGSATGGSQSSTPSVRGSGAAGGKTDATSVRRLTVPSAAASSSQAPTADDAVDDSGAGTGGAAASNVRGAGLDAKSRKSVGSKDKELPPEVQEAEDPDGNAEINRQTLEHFRPAPGAIQAVQASWTRFLARYSSREAAGEAIFQALFETAPSLQTLFTSSKAVQAMKFMIALNDLVSFMQNAENLQAYVETLGFQHLHLQMTSARVAIFRDAILDVFAFELADDLDEEAKNGLTALLNYVGGALIYVRTHYADRLRILLESWKYVGDKAKDGIGGKSSLQNSDTASDLGDSSDADGEGNGQRKAQSGQHNQGKSQWWKPKMFNRRANADGGFGHLMDHNGDDEGKDSKKGGLAHEVEKKMPTTFAEMFAVNAAVMGMNMGTWMNDVLEVFDALVSNVANSARTKEECDVLALRLSKYERSTLNLGEFKACMLAALRSLLPKHWTSAHETAWTWMWENVARLLDQQMDKPERYENALNAYFEGMDEAALFNMRKDTYTKFFELAPAGQIYFKQSNSRLILISEKISGLVLDLFKHPKRLVHACSALGLRHVEFGIPTDLFAPFVSASVEVLATLTQDPVCLEAYSWSLGLIARILVRTLNEGSTLVMKAINANSIKHLRKAIDSAPRRERAAWFLDIQVGTQSISPLSWAIESGSLDVAKAIIKDLLTIRSDRDNYYFGASILFSRHPDIVRRLVEDGLMLLPVLLDGLVWRSHRPEKGLRRINYYVKALLVDESGNFADALTWLAATGDPAIIAHPVVSMVSDTLWSGVVYRQFIVVKMWNILSLVVFMLSQGILPKRITINVSEEERRLVFTVCFAGRLFTYLFGMGRLASFHLSRIWMWCRTTMKRIFDEIDEDGSGSIDWDEFMQASSAFKQSISNEIVKAFKFLKDDDGPATMEDERKAIATQSKSLYNMISFILMVLLAVMLTHEPMLWCIRDPDWPTGDCPQGEHVKYRYSIFSCSAMVIHWLILVDLAVFSTEISAFLLVCGHVMGEVKTFLTALSFLLAMFGSALPIFCDNCPLVAGNFSSIPRATVSLFAITLGWFEADDVMEIRDTNLMLLFVLMIFVGLSVIILLNLLIAQLNRSYEYIYQDMLGFARLNRASLIVEAMTSATKSKWKWFRDSCGFDKNLEFDPGDLGLAGGIQVTEPQALHPVLEDSIRRFGGSTSPDMPWPEDKSTTEDAEDRFDRLEQLLHKALKRMGKKHSAEQAGTGSGGQGTGTGTGSAGHASGDVDKSDGSSRSSDA